MTHLTGTRVAVLATDGFEDSELTSPIAAVQEHGAEVVVVSTDSGSITGKNGVETRVDRRTNEVNADDFDALILPGGVVNGDQIRLDPAAVAFTRDFFTQQKPVGAICHGGWILADADVLHERTVTSYPSLRTDLQNAGATWVDQEVMVDRGLVTSRTPGDLPAFNAAIIAAIADGS